MWNVQAIAKRQNFIFLVALQGMWDLSSPNHCSCSGNTESGHWTTREVPQKCRILIKDVGTNNSGKKIKLEVIVQKKLNIKKNYRRTRKQHANYFIFWTQGIVFLTIIQPQNQKKESGVNSVTFKIHFCRPLQTPNESYTK